VVGFEPAVPEAVQEPDVRDAERGGGRPLLLLPQRRHLLAGRVVETALLTAGAQQVRDLRAGLHQTGDRAGAAEVEVVRMGGDAEHAGRGLGFYGFGHRVRLERVVESSGRPGVGRPDAGQAGSLSWVLMLGIGPLVSTRIGTSTTRT
jgi:hypothetical protein